MAEMVTIVEANVETRNIYIETNIFIAAGYHYDSAVFRKLIKLAEHDEIKLFTTRITNEEVFANIREKVAEALPALKQCRSDASILWKIGGSSFDGLFAKPDKEEIIAELDGRFTDFLDAASVTEIPIAGLDVDSVFDKYFGFETPFAKGEKKSEFPDAFAIAAVLRWCEENDQKMYLVSNDGDWVSACENSDRLISARKPDVLLNEFAITEIDIAEFARGAFDALQRNVYESLGNSFDELGFVLTDQWGEVENVQSGAIDVINEFLIDADETEATFTIDANVDFQADVSFDDMDTAYRDDDTKERVAMEKVEETIRRTANVSAEVIITYDLKAGRETAVLQRVSIEQRDIKVTYDSI